MVTIPDEGAKKRPVWEVTHEADPDGRKLADNHYQLASPLLHHACILRRLGKGEKRKEDK